MSYVLQVGIALIVDIGANNGDSSALEKSKKCASRILERNVSKIPKLAICVYKSEF